MIQSLGVRRAPMVNTDVKPNCGRTPKSGEDTITPSKFGRECPWRTRMSFIFFWSLVSRIHGVQWLVQVYSRYRLKLGLAQRSSPQQAAASKVQRLLSASNPVPSGHSKYQEPAALQTK